MGVGPERVRGPGEADERLAQLYTAWGKKDEAARWQKELDALRSPAQGAKDQAVRAQAKTKGRCVSP